jgi:hypothetical protein
MYWVLRLGLWCKQYSEMGLLRSDKKEAFALTMD